MVTLRSLLYGFEKSVKPYNNERSVTI